MAALLTSITGDTDSVVKYINECREMGIAVEPPDINVSDANFTPHGQAIRFGLAAVKNVGGNAIESIVAARKKLGRNFQSFYEFCEEVDLRLLNKRVLESLIKSGAMDCFGRRAQLMQALDTAIEQAQKAQRDAESGQHGLFGVFADETARAGQRGASQCAGLGRAYAAGGGKRNPRIFYHWASDGEVQGEAGRFERALDAGHCGDEEIHGQG